MTGDNLTPEEWALAGPRLLNLLRKVSTSLTDQWFVNRLPVAQQAINKMIELDLEDARTVVARKAKQQDNDIWRAAAARYGPR